MESGLVNPVGSGLTSLHHANGKQGMSSSQLSAGLLASDASSSCGHGVDLLLPSPSTAFPHSSCPRLWLMGNRKLQCREWLHPSLFMGHNTYTGRLGYGCHSTTLTCSGFCVSPEGGDTDQDLVSHPQGHCLAPFISIAFMAPCLLPLKEVSFSMGLPNVFP